MGYKNVRVSDITGEEIEDSNVVTVAVRQAGKLFDSTTEELAALKRLTSIVELEYRYANGQTEQVLVSQGEFAKLITPEMLEGFDSIRGRRSGFRVNGD